MNGPKHVALIMDGNGRWAAQRGWPRIKGHKAGVQAVHDILDAAADLGIEHLTLYAFSTENWKRPGLEVAMLMALLRMHLRILLVGLLQLINPLILFLDLLGQIGHQRLLQLLVEWAGP